MAVELGRRQLQERIGVGVPVSALTALGGLGILGHVYWQQSVWLILAAVGGPSLAVGVVGWNAASDDTRAWIRHRAAVGLVAGIVGLAAYDAARWIIVLVGGLSVNPFEALPVFGGLLVGEDASATARWIAGSGYHVFNGLGFAVFFAVLLGRRGPLAGIAWALVLEVAMLAVYPGWLDIRARAEFTVVSMSGHVAYGAAIGLVCRRRIQEGM